MFRPIRVRSEEWSVFFVTSRCIHSRFLLRPSQRVNALRVGASIASSAIVRRAMVEMVEISCGLDFNEQVAAFHQREVFVTLEASREVIVAISEDFTTQPLTYYVAKIQRRVFRRMVEYEVLNRRLRDDMEALRPEIISNLGLSPEIIKDVAVKDHIEKACLTGLKAEFELFFTIYCTLVVDRLLQFVEENGCVPDSHKGLLDAVRNKKLFFDGFLNAGLKDARRLYMEQAIPSHGLERLTKLLVDCGWPVLDELGDGGRWTEQRFGDRVQEPWLQIRMAFQVRHAIEHSFSKVGRPFRLKTEALWSRSTWARHFEGDGGPQLEDRVPVDSNDIRGTAAAMTWTASALLEHWNSVKLPLG